MKLMGKGGKRHVAKKVEKRTAARRSAKNDYKHSAEEIVAEQEVHSSADIFAESEQFEPNPFTEPTPAQTANRQSNAPASPVDSAHYGASSSEEIEVSVADLPKLTKTPPPPKYLQQATRIPTNLNPPAEPPPNGQEARIVQTQVQQKKVNYARKPQAEQPEPALPGEMPQRDPSAPRSHIKPISIEHASAPAGTQSGESESKQTPQSMPEQIILVEPVKAAETKRFTPKTVKEQLPPDRPKDKKRRKKIKDEELAVPQSPPPNRTRRPGSAANAPQAKNRKATGDGTQSRAPSRPASTDPQKKAQKVSTKKKTTGSKAALILMALVVVLGASFAGLFYWWTTYSVFESDLQAVVVIEGSEVNPMDFLYDPGDVTAQFRDETFAAVAGRQTVPLTLSDGLRTTDAVAVLYVLTPVRQIVTEFRQEAPNLTPIDMLSNPDAAGGVPFDVQFVSQPLPLAQYEIGEHTIDAMLNGVPFFVRLTVEDTTPPTATPVSKSIVIGEEVSAEDFVTDVYDASQIVSIEFVNIPDFTTGRDQIVEIAITDAFGNTYVTGAALSVTVNVEPPVFEGIQPIHSLVGNPIIFRQGVTAFDDFGRELEFHVETDRIDQHTVGTYTALYWVEDFSGNRTEVEVDVYIIEIDPEYVDARVDEIIEGILNDDMTQVDQARAILRWVRSNVSMVQGVRGGPASVYEGAYRALRDRRGNCYIFFSISERLLTRAGIPNMRISRTPGVSTNHHWNLINPDELGWHHFDSMPSRFDWSPTMYMFTQSQAERFARDQAPYHGNEHYYTFDPALYPPIVP